MLDVNLADFWATPSAARDEMIAHRRELVALLEKLERDADERFPKLQANIEAAMKAEEDAAASLVKVRRKLRRLAVRARDWAALEYLRIRDVEDGPWLRPLIQEFERRRRRERRLKLSRVRANSLATES